MHPICRLTCLLMRQQTRAFHHPVTQMCSPLPPLPVAAAQASYDSSTQDQQLHSGTRDAHWKASLSLNCFSRFRVCYSQMALQAELTTSKTIYCLLCPFTRCDLIPCSYVPLLDDQEAWQGRPIGLVPNRRTQLSTPGLLPAPMIKPSFLWRFWMHYDPH
jgi:hypothetical protein